MESNNSRYALWLETFYPANPKPTRGVLATILQRPTPPAQRKVHEYSQGARVFTSEQCIKQMVKKERKKEMQEKKERRKIECEKRRQKTKEAAERAVDRAAEKAAKKKGTPYLVRLQ